MLIFIDRDVEEGVYRGAFMKALYGIILVLLLMPSISFSQASRVRVAVTHSGDDAVGRTMAFALKEAIRGSQSFVLFEHDYKNPTILVRMVSVEAHAGEKGISSAVAIVIAYDSVNTPASGILLELVVRACGRDRAVGCGKDILSYIDQSTEDLRRNNPDLWQKVRLN
jgi:hypothetical protein